MDSLEYGLRPIGFVHSALTDRGTAPKQGGEDAPDAWIAIEPGIGAGLSGIAAGDAIIVITWLHEGRRDVLQVHPRGDLAAPPAGVFATRSPDRPNPIGLHRVEVLAISEAAIHVRPIEVISGTPVIDIKPVLDQVRDE